MRFKQYLKEAVSNKEMNEWFRQYEVEAYINHTRMVQSYHYIYDNGIQDDISDIYFSTISGDTTWNPPIRSDEWGKITTFQFLKNTGRQTVTSFESIPNVKSLYFDDTTIKSLKGVDNLSEVNFIGIGSWVKFECGLLRLLKMPNLRRLDLSNFLGDQPLEDALEIVKKHVEDGEHDIVACQTELMDANIEEYAKL